jgi:ATP-dependent Clp protease protease subunit
MSPEEARDWGLIDAIFTERAELAVPVPELPIGR